MATTPSMTGFEFGDVVLVPFPFTDQSALKQRPAVVVSSAAYQDRRHDLIIMAITSRLRPLGLGEVDITEWQAAGLLKPSVLKAVARDRRTAIGPTQAGSTHRGDLAALRQVLHNILGP
jgi:mRNA-degrading endonuclease toxin of MazEF toxin-antitoxin module